MFDNYDNCFKVIIINFNFLPLILRKNNEKKYVISSIGI